MTSPSAPGIEQASPAESPLQVSATAPRVTERWRLDWKSFAVHRDRRADRVRADRHAAELGDDADANRHRDPDRAGARPAGVLVREPAQRPTRARRRRRRAAGPRGRRAAGRCARAAGRHRDPPVLAPVPRDRRRVSSGSPRSAAGSRTRTSRPRAEEWVEDLPEQFTDERLESTARRLVAGLASVAIVTVVAISVLIDGENLVRRFRRLLRPARRAQADEVGRVVYRTIGRYIGGSMTVRGDDGDLRADHRPDPRHSAGAAGGDLGDAHRPHPPGRWIPRRSLLRAAGGDRERAGRRSPPARCSSST